MPHLSFTTTALPVSSRRNGLGFTGTNWRGGWEDQQREREERTSEPDERTSEPLWSVCNREQAAGPGTTARQEHTRDNHPFYRTHRHVFCVCVYRVCARGVSEVSRLRSCGCSSGRPRREHGVRSTGGQRRESRLHLLARSLAAHSSARRCQHQPGVQSVWRDSCVLPPRCSGRTSRSWRSA